MLKPLLLFSLPLFSYSFTYSLTDLIKFRKSPNKDKKIFGKDKKTVDFKSKTNIFPNVFSKYSSNVFISYL